MFRLVDWMTVTIYRAGWAPTAVFLIFLAWVQGISVFALVPYSDIPMHFLGGVAIAYFWHTASIVGSERGLLGVWHPTTHGLLVFGWTTVAAIVWEFAEFTLDRLTGSQLQGGGEWGALADTFKDVLLGMAGSGCWVLFVSLLGRKVSSPSSGQQNIEQGGGVPA